MMKRHQISGAGKRKIAKENEEKTLNIVSKIPKLNTFFTQVPKDNVQPPDQMISPLSQVDLDTNTTLITSKSNYDNEIIEVIQPGSGSTSSTCDLILPINSLNTSGSTESTAKFEAGSSHTSIHAEVINENESLVGYGDEMIHSANADVNLNKAKDPGLWLDFSTDDVDYWIFNGPNDCQHHNGPFDKSYRHFPNGPSRYCSQKLFVGTKSNGEKYKREWLLYSPSTGSVYCFVCKLFAKHLTNFATRGGFSDWRNIIIIDSHEKNTTHRDAMLTYLTRRQGTGLRQQLDEQIREECDYWEHVLRRVIAVIRTLAERGLAFRGTEEIFGSLHNGNFLGLLELISQFDPFLASHISKYGNSGKGNASYLSKTICEELIQIMAQKVQEHIIDEVKTSGYFSLSVDSTPDLSHIDQLSVVLRYLKDGQPIERFLTFLELKSHTGEEMANQVLQYLSEVLKINILKCRGQSYDNAANMSGRYKGMQQKILERNKFAIYVPCAAHSLNLVGRSAVDCCEEAVNFFAIAQMLYTFFSASTSRWKILKDCIGNESVLKSLSDTRWEAHAVATTAILKSFQNILEALECIAQDQKQKGDTKREATNIANKMTQLEFVFMLHLWDEILQNFRRVSKVLQKEEVNLKTCADLYGSLADHLCSSREEFEKYETAAKKTLPDVDYEVARKRFRKKLPNDGDAPEIYLNARDKFRINTFYTIIDKLQAEMRKRGEIYKEIAEKFCFLSDVFHNDHNVTPLSTENEMKWYSQCCQKLIESYPEDLNTNFSTELQQFHLYVRHKFSATKNAKTRFSHAELYKLIVDDNIEDAFANVDISLRIFLTLMVTNCSAERSFSQLKHIKNPNRATMQQDRLDALSILCIEADVLRNISFENVIKEFAARKTRRKLFKTK